VHAITKVPDIAFQVVFVSLHRHSIDPSAGRAPLPPKRAPERGLVDMVQQRREPGMARSPRRHMDPVESG
jgi:hypothetical protein